jgi:hypothetical protein
MNKTLSLPIADLAPAGDKVFDWLGTLWTSIFEDTQLVRNWTTAQGLLSAQLYLNFIETLNLPDRHESPVFHRDRWRMLTIRQSARNTGNAVALRLGSDNPAVVGKQVEAPYVPGHTPVIGGHTAITGLTAYPLDDAITDVLTVITDDIATPTKVLVSGVDFSIKDGTILFYNNSDPFVLGFPVRTINSPDGDDTEIALWAGDVMVDRNYVYNYLGHVLGLRDVSSEFYTTYLNALWDIHNAGASLALFKSGIAALLDEPYVKDGPETVQYVLTTPRRQVITDKHVYDITASAMLRSCIVPGAVLQSGALFTETIHVWENLDPARFAAGNQDMEQFKRDMPALFLPPGFFRAELKHGLGVTWDLQPLTYQGADANGNARLRFTVYGSDADIEAFWNDFETYCENNNVAIQTCFTEHLYSNVQSVFGAEWGLLSPFEYFLTNFLKTNLMIVAVDSQKLSAQGRQTMHLLGNLRNAMPAHTCFFVVERQDVSQESYNLEESVDDTLLAMLAVPLYEMAGTVVYVKTNLRYGDAQPRVSWVPTCRRTADESNT